MANGHSDRMRPHFTAWLPIFISEICYPIQVRFAGAPKEHVDRNDEHDDHRDGKYGVRDDRRQCPEPWPKHFIEADKPDDQARRRRPKGDLRQLAQARRSASLAYVKRPRAYQDAD